MKSSLTVLISILLFSTVSLAADVYVSPSGSDANTGTISSPFLSLSKAYGNASAGSTIYLRGGIYQPISKIVLDRSGTAASPIRIFAYANEVPVIDGSKESERWRSLVEVTGNYNHIRGIEIRNASNMGISIQGSGSHNTIERMNVHHSGRLWDEGSGISIFGTAANNLLLNNDSHHNFAPLVPGNADGIRSSSRGTGNVLRGNRAYRNADDGFDMWNGTPTVLEGNIAFENGYDDNFKRLGDGNGFKLGGHFANSSSGGHTLYNNVAFKNPMHGFDENQATTPFTLLNNTAYNNGPDMPGGVGWAGNYGLYKPGHVVRNNVSLGKLGEVNGTTTNNSWNLFGTLTSSDFISLNDVALRGARNSDGSLPVTDFLRPNAISRLVDQGVDIGRQFAGKAPDLGAYESGSRTPTEPVVIQNHSFENGNFAWENWGNSAIVQGYASEGRSSLKITGEGGRGQVVNLTPGATYILRFAAKRRINGKEGCTVGISAKDANGSELRMPYVSVTSKSSSTYELPLAVPTNVVSTKVFVWKDAGSNSCFVDDFKISRR